MPYLFTLLTALGLSTTIFAEAPSLAHTTLFQANGPWNPEIDIQTDLAVVYGSHGKLEERLERYQASGYRLGFMTGISWGRYDDYYRTDAGLKTAEIQTRKDGSLFWHGNSKTVGYNVPTAGYIEYIKRVVDPAIREGVEAIFLEEPEFWAESGWSTAFQSEWARHYESPWESPDSSMDAQYRASKLKYELYRSALEEVFRYIKTQAAKKDLDIKCYVPTHSMINYAHWRIVSPESSLAAIPECDGYIAQVWTGTARTPNWYRNQRRERTFEAAYFEYGQMLAMTRPTGRQVWFLHDPVEDNPSYSWEDYEKNYEATVVASLLWPEVTSFEVMPWPHRIFQGEYEGPDGEKTPMPEAYRTKLMTVVQALGNMNQPVVRRESGSPGIGIVVSDSMMFQRAIPLASEDDLSSFYGLAMPLIKHGIAAEVVQMETLQNEAALDGYKLLILSYEGQKPLDRRYHDVLEAWVRQGGALLYVGDGTDRYHQVPEWWNDHGDVQRKAYEDLFERLGIENEAYNEPMAVDDGWVRVFAEKPRQLARYALGPDKLMEIIGELYAEVAGPLAMQQHLLVQRGPYVIAAALSETGEDQPLKLEGRFIDLFDATLPYKEAVVVAPGRQAFLYDLSYAADDAANVRLIAGAARIHGEEVAPGQWHFQTRGPDKVPARARILLPGPPTTVETQDDFGLVEQWDATSGTLLVEWPNAGKELVFQVAIEPAIK